MLHNWVRSRRTYRLVTLCLALFICSSSVCHKVHDPDDKEHEKFERDILLGEEDVDGYSKLSDGEKEQRLRGLASKMDADQDGLITEQELHRWLKRNHLQYIVTRAKQFFVDTDADEDGFVSFQEYEKMQYEGMVGVPSNYKKSTLYKHEQSRFRYADVNKDQKLTMEEFVYFLNPEEGQHMLDAIVQETIDNMDIDGDGKMSVKDYIGEAILDMDKEDFLAKVKEFKEEWDKDQDGTLDLDEMRKWISSDRPGTAYDETKHLLEHGDQDKDNRLSYDEVVAMRTMLESSEATQYGDLLKEEL